MALGWCRFTSSSFLRFPSNLLGLILNGLSRCTGPSPNLLLCPRRVDPPGPWVLWEPRGKRGRQDWLYHHSLHSTIAVRSSACQNSQSLALWLIYPCRKLEKWCWLYCCAGFVQWKNGYESMLAITEQLEKITFHISGLEISLSLPQEQWVACVFQSYRGCWPVEWSELIHARSPAPTAVRHLPTVTACADPHGQTQGTCSGSSRLEPWCCSLAVC